MSAGRSCAVFLLVVLGGCGGGDAPLPSEIEAKTALTSALDLWKAGKPASELAASKPSIQAVDQDWTSGKILENYTVGAEIPGTGNKTFAVSLTLKGSSSPLAVQYMVFGKDPVRVYRDVDFERMSNMENNPTPAKKPKR
jgi:hypothetical protein